MKDSFFLAGWRRHPSGWRERLPAATLALVGCAIATYLALYQLGIISSRRRVGLNMSQTGKRETVVITGASAGVGRATVRAFAQGFHCELENPIIF
jgi:NADPH:quinone reductase-like Zn-dependent oxidoreductase